MRVLPALFLSALPLAVFPQTTNNEALTRAYNLIEQGRPENAAVILATFAYAATATNSERGRAEALLGLAFKEQGRFHAAEHSFETALGLLDTPGQPNADYASALDYDAGLELLLSDIA